MVALPVSSPVSERGGACAGVFLLHFDASQCLGSFSATGPNMLWDAVVPLSFFLSFLIYLFISFSLSLFLSLSLSLSVSLSFSLSLSVSFGAAVRQHM